MTVLVARSGAALQNIAAIPALGDEMAQDFGGAPRFSVGVVISTSLSMLIQNILRFLAIMLVVGVPVALLIGGGVAVMLMSGSDVTAGAGGGMNLKFAGGSNTVQVLFIIFAGFLGVLAYFLIQAAITYGTLQSLSGRKATVGACIANGLNALPRILLASLVLFAGVVVIGFVTMLFWGLLASVGGAVIGIIGSLGLAVGILYIVVLIWVFVPAIVVERAGAVDCFSRSMALTQGHRWGIFGILALVFIANWVVSFISQALQSAGAAVAGSAIDIVSGLFFSALGSVLAAVGYYTLRAAKEGVQIDDVVKVFD
jgi:hypothetical protein